jgi:hypothetical protein
MKKIVVLVLGLTIVASCGETKNEEEVLSTQEETTIETINKEFFGDTITTEGAIDMTTLVSQLEENDSVIGKVTGTVNAVCKKKGCWMTMPINDSVDMRVRFKDYEFFVPLNCENRKATIKGIAKKAIITVDMLKHYAEDAGDSQEVIDAITEDEVEYSFLATGVILE